MIKPQFGVVALPLVGIVLLRRHIFRPDDQPRNPVLAPRRLRGWFEYERGPWRSSRPRSRRLVVLMVLIIPFSLDPIGLVQLVASDGRWLQVPERQCLQPVGDVRLGRQPAACLRWRLVVRRRSLPRTADRLRYRARYCSASASRSASCRVAWRDDRRSIILVTLFLALGFFMLPTRVHERYMFPIFAFLPLLAVVNRRWAGGDDRPVDRRVHQHARHPDDAAVRDAEPRERCRWASSSANRLASSPASSCTSSASCSSAGRSSHERAEEADEYELGALARDGHRLAAE